VGTGKTMLLGAFFKNVNLTKKRKISFHNFMIEIHKQLYNLRQTENNRHNREDYLETIADSLVSKYRLLYIDELEIQDITDAMIVGKLFRELFERNIMIIITSNRKPNDLYLNGLQRDSFLEFIDLINDKLEIFELKSGKDYRLEKITSFKQTFFSPLGKGADNFVKQSFSLLSAGNNPSEIKIAVNQRDIICKNTFKDIALFNFSELFQVPLGSADYMALCNHFNIIILSNIPKLGKSERNEARRFIDFIDILYENKTILICTSEAETHSIYNSGDGKFEFERTISRLIEMQSDEYLRRKLC